MKLSPADCRKALRRLRGWKIVKGRLERTWAFKDFDDAYRVVSHIARISRTLDHHPDLKLGWGYVSVSLTTHDAHGLTRLDFIAASRITSRASSFARR